MVLDIIDFGLRPYREILAYQQECVGRRRAGLIGDTALLGEHPPVITLGKAASRQTWRAAADAAVFEVIPIERGGGATVHLPGQLVAYPILDLQARGGGVRRLVRDLEEVLIRSAAACGVDAYRRAGFPGAWAADKKIGFVGLGVRRFISYHGISLNVAPDLNCFAPIHPCGLSADRIGSIREQGGEPADIDALKKIMSDCLARLL
ncbi:MAG: lipoyl(octanoyl) transferase LipB [Candidatus Omnitrophica bacterium]|nr:lipoyl(octanoyl) transferase LipB [Candidatus Omnitrophota bacterium]